MLTLLVFHQSFAGGMTVAFHDCIHLTRILSPSPALPDLDDWHVYAPAIQRWHWERKNLAAVVNVLSVALYDLFGADGSFASPCLLLSVPL
jgi:squalene monooxygenase